MTKVIEIHPEGNTSVQNVMANIPANVAFFAFQSGHFRHSDVCV